MKYTRFEHQFTGENEKGMVFQKIFFFSCKISKKIQGKGFELGLTSKIILFALVIKDSDKIAIVKIEALLLFKLFTIILL